MFGYSEDLRSLLDPEDLNQLETNFTSNRKSSFIDLLSYNRSAQDPTLEDLQNLDSLLNGSINPDIQIFHFQGESVQLKLDDFPDINCASNNKNWQIDSSKAYQKQVIKVNTQLIGNLTAQERRKKIQRYLDKKKKRTWVKKIHYDCRKKVADNRLRVKGRFVTRNKANDITKDQSKPDTKDVNN